jgi:hypothetical protein
MKKVLLALSLLAITGSVMAQHHHGHGLRPYYGGGYYYRGPGPGWWVAPVVVGAIGYELGRQQTVVVQQPQVNVQTPPPINKENCTPWTETQSSDGTITRTRTCQ